MTSPSASSKSPIVAIRQGDLTERVGRITITPSDMLMFAAVAMLPFDGTKVGVALPYWTPISPWLFLLYAAVNWRYLRDGMRRFLPFFLLPALLLVMSFHGWLTIGTQPAQIAKSLLSIVLALACLSSIDIALRCKRIPVRVLVTTLFAAYTVAFLTGVLQYVALTRNADWKPVRVYFWQLIARYYASTRPQFMFAEPSYIGMHVFGVLLPVFWLTRDRRIGVLVPVFAIGAIVMGSGTRIVIDSVVAAVLWIISDVTFRSRRITLGIVAALSVLIAGGASAVISNARLHSLASRGLLSGDGSMSARIFHMLAPMWSWGHDPEHLLFGWGPGNIYVAVRSGYSGARRWYDAHGGAANAEIDGLAKAPADTFTMSAYASFITEFGLLCFIAFAAAVIIHISVHRAWNRHTVCWLILLVYLYVQFEAYAFYAIPLFLWATGTNMKSIAFNSRSNSMNDD